MDAYSLHRISLVNVSAFLLYRTGEALLVDCGNQGSEKKIIGEMASLGIQPGMLKLLILTHSHYDHAGAAFQLKEATGCRIMIHRSEASRLEAGYTPIPAGTRWKAKVISAVGRIFARRLMRYPPVLPDILLDELTSLDEFGFPGKVIHTPGHTRGSLVVLMEDGEMIAGDTLMGLAGKRIFPAFAEDIPGLMQSWKMLSEMKVKNFHPAHGRTISFRKFLNEFSELTTAP